MRELELVNWASMEYENMINHVNKLILDDRLVLGSKWKTVIVEHKIRDSGPLEPPFGR